MHSSKHKLSPLLLLSLLSLSLAAPILDPQCGYCSHPHPDPHPHPRPRPHPHPHPRPPINLPPIVKPPINLPPISLPPVTVPKVPVVPPVTVPPVIDPPKGECPPPPLPQPPATATCPIDSLKLGACVDLLGGLIHIGLGDPAANECCPLISGLVELEAAVCLCTTLKIKALNLNIYIPLALQLLITCGKAPPPGYTCSL